MGGEPIWNPWRALRERDHLELRWGWFPPGARGRIDDIDPPPRRVITLHAGLGRVERRATLAHELVHDERGVPPLDYPPHLRAKEERAVRCETARRLVPLDQLRSFAAQRCSIDGEAVTVDQVCEAFDVPADVAQLACQLAV